MLKAESAAFASTTTGFKAPLPLSTISRASRLDAATAGLAALGLQTVSLPFNYSLDLDSIRAFLTKFETLCVSAENPDDGTITTLHYNYILL